MPWMCGKRIKYLRNGFTIHGARFKYFRNGFTMLEMT